jgi:hypothetical protein
MGASSRCLPLLSVHQVFGPGQDEKVCHCHRFGCPDLTERTYGENRWVTVGNDCEGVRRISSFLSLSICMHTYVHVNTDFAARC